MAIIRRKTMTKNQKNKLLEIIRPLVRKALLENTTDDLIKVDSTWTFGDTGVDVKRLHRHGIEVYVNPENVNMDKKDADEIYLKIDRTDLNGVAAVMNCNAENARIVGDFIAIDWD